MKPATCNLHHHVQADSAVLVVAANVDMEDPNDDAAQVLLTQAIVLKCAPFPLLFVSSLTRGEQGA